MMLSKSVYSLTANLSVLCGLLAAYVVYQVLCSNELSSVLNITSFMISFLRGGRMQRKPPEEVNQLPGSSTAHSAATFNNLY